MAKEKNSSGASTPTKATKSRTTKAATQSRLKVVATGAAAPSGGNGHREPSPAELDQEIRLRAYQYYCERGGQHGAHEDDWHRAEHEVREKYRVNYNYGT